MEDAAKTFCGHSLTITKKDVALTADNAKAVKADIVCNNRVTRVIDTTVRPE